MKCGHDYWRCCDMPHLSPANTATLGFCPGFLPQKSLRVLAAYLCLARLPQTTLFLMMCHCLEGTWDGTFPTATTPAASPGQAGHSLSFCNAHRRENLSGNETTGGHRLFFYILFMFLVFLWCFYRFDSLEVNNTDFCCENRMDILWIVRRFKHINYFLWN